MNDEGGSSALALVEETAGPVKYEEPRELTIEEVEAQVAKIEALMQRVLKRDQHYGVIPGTGEKPTLLQPGAEKINLMFRIGPGKPEVEEVPLGGGHMDVKVTLPMLHLTTGKVLGYGFGSCSTMESKYRYRSASRKCPTCGKETIIKGKAEYGGGWLCFAKKGGCGAKFAEDDSAITGQVVGKIENPDIADVYNTVRKMAYKRAYVGGTIKVTAASDFFTQDLEDMHDNGGPEEERKAEPAPAPAKAKPAAKAADAELVAREKKAIESLRTNSPLAPQLVVDKAREAAQAASDDRKAAKITDEEYVKKLEAIAKAVSDEAQF
ncbi:MAG: hypothetical protein PHS14_18260 [Elusimicrobia bacterium]|nr:hypothetical protein [Elusimicrobiota bacterium]